MIDITGLDRTAVIQALYDAARPLGMGFLNYKAGPLDWQEASQLVGRNIDYLHGRVMKVEIGSDSNTFEEKDYDRNNGPGAAARAVDALRSGDTDALRAVHVKGVAEAAAEAQADMREDDVRESQQGDWHVVEVSLPKIPELSDAIERAKKATEGAPPHE